MLKFFLFLLELSCSPLVGIADLRSETQGLNSGEEESDVSDDETDFSSDEDVCEKKIVNQTFHDKRSETKETCQTSTKKAPKVLIVTG